MGLPKAKGPRSRAADVNTRATSGSRARGPSFRRLPRTTTCTRTKPITSSSRPLRPSTAPRLLDGEARGALVRARSLAIDELIQIIERSGLRGRGGAGYPFAEKVRAV